MMTKQRAAALNRQMTDDPCAELRNANRRMQVQLEGYMQALANMKNASEKLADALELAAKNVTWVENAAGGGTVALTYGYHVASCQAALADYRKDYPKGIE